MEFFGLSLMFAFIATPTFAQAPDIMMREEARKKVEADRQKIHEDRVSNASKAMQEANRENLRRDRQIYRQQKAQEIFHQSEETTKEINERGRQGRP